MKTNLKATRHENNNWKATNVMKTNFKATHAMKTNLEGDRRHGIELERRHKPRKLVQTVTQAMKTNSVKATDVRKTNLERDTRLEINNWFML